METCFSQSRGEEAGISLEVLNDGQKDICAVNEGQGGCVEHPYCI
jgi:hypothetical protein